MAVLLARQRGSGNSTRTGPIPAPLSVKQSTPTTWDDDLIHNQTKSPSKRMTGTRAMKHQRSQWIGSGSFVQWIFIYAAIVCSAMCFLAPTAVQGNILETARPDIHSESSRSQPFRYRTNSIETRALEPDKGRALGGDVITALGAAAAIVTAVSVAVSVATCFVVKSDCIGGIHKDKDEDDDFAFAFNPDLLQIQDAPPVVSNNAPIPVPGRDLRFDGCADGSIRFPNGTCLPVLKQGPCPPLHWITVDPVTLEGICRRRLCGLSQVYVPRYQRCHDILDGLECPGGRRLYYTAYGDPICDCPTGQYAFPTPASPCVRLFTQGPCLPGQIVGLNEQSQLSCLTNECGLNTNSRRSWLAAMLSSSRKQDNRFQTRQSDTGADEKVSTQAGPRVRYTDGFCYALGTQGPCQAGQTLGLDPIQKRIACRDLLDPESPYSLKATELGQLRANYSSWPVNYPDYVAVLIRQAERKQQYIDEEDLDEWDRQDNSAGVLQFPMLNPCRPGGRNGNNFKCTNPLVSMQRSADVGMAAPARPRFSCGSGQVLIAAGECRASSGIGAGATGANSCGPSFNFQGGGCRQSLALLSG